MSTLTIEDLVMEYQRTFDEDVFERIYEEVSANWSKMIPRLARRYVLDEHDVSSVAHEKLFEVAKNYEREKGTFKNMLGRAIRLGCVDLVRERKRHESHYLFDDFAKVERYTDRRANAEEECIEYLQKKYDQRQLVERLMELADDKTRQSLIAFIESGFSYTNAAKRLGTTRKTVRRRITNLAKFVHDNYRDYFTVPTESKSRQAETISA